MYMANTRKLPKSPKPCKYGTRKANGKCPAKCANGDRLESGECPPRKCKYGERKANGKCPAGTRKKRAPLKKKMRGFSASSIKAQSIKKDMNTLIIDSSTNFATLVIPDNITRIIMDGQKRSIIPFKLPPNLVYLSCTDCGLKSLPEDLPDSLEDIYAGFNQLSRLPAKLPPNLEVLYVNDNQLTEIKPELPSSLKELDISNNKLSKLPKLPSGLNILVCMGNPYTEGNDPRFAFADLPADLETDIYE
jgi:Leucine-rich repeat (LRR) protein